MHVVLETEPHCWVFHSAYPEGCVEVLESARQALLEERYDAAEKLLRQLLLVCPEHIEGWQHLGLAYGATGDGLLAYACASESVRLGERAFPSRFSWYCDRLTWNRHENRPFLSSCHTLALLLRQHRGPAEAIELLARQVSVNPMDQLGARLALMQCYLATQCWREALALATAYPEDHRADILYSKVVALLHLDCRREALRCLTEAVRSMPHVAAFLSSSSRARPRAATPAAGTDSLDEEAFDYWSNNSSHWAAGTVAHRLLQQVMDHH